METTGSVEQVDTLMDREDVITDTIPSRIFDAVERYYVRHGYRLQSWTRASAGTYDATFTR